MFFKSKDLQKRDMILTLKDIEHIKKGIVSASLTTHSPIKQITYRPYWLQLVKRCGL